MSLMGRWIAVVTTLGLFGAEPAWAQAPITNVTITLTNDATLAWLWKTQHLAQVVSPTNGYITGATNDWYDQGSSVSFTASSSNHYHFTGWSGDVEGDTSAAAMTVTLDRPRTLTAEFAIDTHALIVTTPYGTPMPGTTNLAYNTVVTQQLVSPVVVNPTNSGTRFRLIGPSVSGNEITPP